MLQERTYQRAFSSAPQSVTSLVAEFLEPIIIVLSFLAATLVFGEPINRPALTLCLLVFAFTFPGRNRFRAKMFTVAVDLLTSWVVLAAVLLLCGYATRSLHYFEPQVLIAWLVSTPVLQWLAVRLGKEVVKYQAARASARHKAIVVGAGVLGVKVAKVLAESEEYGIAFMGYFEDRGDDRVQREAKVKRLGGLKDVAQYITAHSVRDVYITLPLGSQPRIVELLDQIQSTTASLFFVPDIFGISIIQGRLQDMNGMPVVGICETPFTGINKLVKRISDLVLASIILVTVAPLMLVLAIGVKLSSPGPAIFGQRRNGLDGDEITVYKFRSMTTQDNGTVVAQATRHDPRITPFGRFIRRTSLDELPQLFNVLQGRMSIVGPRPHAVAHNELYRQVIKAYMVRHKVKPGITGWAQVNGYRGETDTIEKMQARVECDLEYLRNWSLRLDLQIIARSIRIVFFDRQAY